MKGNWTGITLVAIAAAALAIGCGSEKLDQASAGSATPAAAVAQSTEPSLQSPVVEAPQAESLGTNVAEEPGPEVAASIGDTLVVPGGVVEITAEASEDVVEVVLQDDLGRKQPLGYDAEHKTWRTTYRVPMRVPTERLGLSVTARNDAHRWRRVWLFLGVRSEGSTQ